MTQGEEMVHWTEGSIDDYLYRIASDFVLQLEDKIDSGVLSHVQLAQKLGVSKGRVSQILNNPGNLTLKMMIRCARALGMKIAVVAYDDDDYNNEHGPVNSDIFRICWENSGKPADFWSLPECPNVVGTAALSQGLDFQATFVSIQYSHTLPSYFGPMVPRTTVWVRAAKQHLQMVKEGMLMPSIDEAPMFCRKQAATIRGHELCPYEDDTTAFESPDFGDEASTGMFNQWFASTVH
jgi:transcriptional regulator with XRE-family HTH domain